MGIRSLFTEWLARRRGRRFVETGLARSAREIVGPTGAMLSRGWDAMSRGSEAYNKSFDPKIPPSVFVSARDLTRSNHPVPLVERCIEDWSSEAEQPAP
jgi:hypothetical protein